MDSEVRWHANFKDRVSVGVLEMAAALAALAALAACPVDVCRHSAASVSTHDVITVAAFAHALGDAPVGRWLRAR